MFSVIVFVLDELKIVILKEEVEIWICDLKDKVLME